MEKLGRGVVALHSATAQAYISWRLLVTDPTDIGFNVYRSTAGAPGVKLNLSGVISNTTDFLDTTANFTVSNAWYVVPVIGGSEQTPSASSGLAANSPVRQYLTLPLQPVAGGAFPPYDVKFGWFGDFDGDGEFDYLVDRLSETGGVNQYLQAYKRDGTLLWQMNMGYNSTNQYSIEPGASAISTGDKEGVTVYDLDGDGKAEVIVRTARGVVLPDSTTIAGPNDTTQYLSILDGLTGVEKARATVPNPFAVDGPLNCHAGIAYFDGIRPSVILSGENRIGSGSFQRITTAWDYRNGVLTQRWTYQTPVNHNDSEGHQLRVADVNHDGKDDLIRIASVIAELTNGVPTTLYSTELVHGDRYHVTDIDPGRAGLEMYAIQQNNTTLLATSLQDLNTGVLFKKWYSGGVTDVGRGLAVDIYPNYRGVEVFSTQPGIFDCKGNQVSGPDPWPWEGIWWDDNVLREFFAARDGDGLRPCINRWNYTAGTEDLMYNVQTEGVHSQYGARPAIFGDLFGDWREEFMVVADDYSAVRIYTTKTVATNRIPCLMQNPQYRVQCTFRGYYQGSYPDFYLGQDMPAVPVPPVSDAQLVWRGGVSSTWDTSAANWFTNNLWISNTTPVAFLSASSVLFDLSGSIAAPIQLTGSLTPSDVRVHSPKNYTFDGPGSLTGAMKLTKAGAGKLVLNGTNSFTGATLVGEGAFIVNGSLPNSPVTVRGGIWHDGRLGGTGVVGSTVRFEEAAGFSPGAGINSPGGTLTISSNVTLTGRTLSDFDLSDNPAGSNDRVVINGNLTLQGTNTLVIRKLNPTLPPGSVYPLINYSGALSGSLNNLAVSGLPGVPYALTNPPGQIALVLKSYRAPAIISWTGGSGGNAWDLLTTSNWLNGVAKDQFAPGDTVRFDSIGTSNLTANLIGDLNAANVIVDSTANYTLTGGGAVIGAASLLKSNSGTLTITANNNAFTGRTVLAGGTVIVSELDAAGYASPLGNVNTSPTNLVLTGNATLRVTGESYTDRGLTLGLGSTNSFDVFNAADQVTMAGLITGSGAFQKLGAGVFAVTRSNNYTGATIIKAGSISLGGDEANVNGMGASGGTVVLDGGGFTMYNDVGGSSDDTSTWNLIVPTGSTGFINADGRCKIAGTLSGGGTLTFWTPYVRTDINGNWSAFAGQINITTDSDGGHFRMNNSAGYPNASMNLAAGVNLYSIISGTPTIDIGAISGAGSAYIIPSAKASGDTPTSFTLRVGGRNTDTTFAGNIGTGATVSLIKQGTGTWTLSGTNTYTGTTTINAGGLLVNGNNASALGGVTVAASGTLGGIGTIGANVTVNGRLAPGNNALGTLTCTNNVTFNASGIAVIEVRKTPKTNDLLRVLRQLSYGGTLTVTNLAGTLALGDSFKIFDATTYQGGFAALNLPPLPKGLTWYKPTLAASGTISVVTNPPPRITSASVAGGNVLLSGSGGGPFLDYYLLRATNVSLPAAQWTRVLTNQFDATGSFNLSIANDPVVSAQFYCLQVP